MRRLRRRSFLGTLLLRLALVLLAVVGGYLAWLYAIVTLPSPESHSRQPIGIYSAPYRLAAGSPADPARFIERLEHLGYRQVRTRPLAPGQYRITPGGFDVYVRPSPIDGDRLAEPQLVTLVLDGGRIARLERPSGDELRAVALEPMLISGVVGHTRMRREWVALSEIPQALIDAVLAIEDRRFHRHPGLDPLAIARALWENLWRGRIVQGGSTITQQLAKNLYFSSERTLLRKVREACAALVLEWKYRKSEILEAYLNEIYFGQVGSVGVYGVAEAAKAYFGKDLGALSLPELAVLAGMIKAPNLYSPLKDGKQAKRRRDLVLQRLHEEGLLSAKALKAALKTPLRPMALQTHPSDAPYFVDYVLQQYEIQAGEGPPSGERLLTTLDLEMQRLAEEALRRGLARLEARHPALRRPESPLQGAVVVLEPDSGSVRAMIGGRDYRESQFNRAVQARRQAGSLFKPFIYLTAFERSVEEKENPITPASLIQDAPLAFPSGPSTWAPQNFDRRFHGEVTVRAALEQSLNIPAVRVAQRVGIGRVADTLRAFGIKEPLQEELSLALGTAEVSLLEMTAAFGALANGGLLFPTSGLRHEPVRPHRVASAQAAFLIDSLLKGVVEHGTAAQARALGLPFPVAGKTGTTDDHRDAWFIGYTPELAIGVWIGFDDGRSLGLTGAQAALPIWVDLARQLLPSAEPPSAPAAPPPGIVARRIDPVTSLLATTGCPEAVEEWFIEGTEPQRYCEVHAGFWRRLRDVMGL